MSFETVFWLCLGCVAYVYVGYAALVWCLARLIGRQTKKGNIEPHVTVLIAAFNEAREIEQTVVNKLQQEYPAERLEVIVVSDGSTDGTAELASLEPPPPEMQRIFAAVAGNQEAMDGFARVNAGVTSPAEYFSEENVARILGAADGSR